MKRFGERVKMLRQAQSLTQEDLAEAVGVSDRTIRSIESGASGPTLITIGKLADALGIEVMKLFDFPQD